jgi:FtsH-binding integral membrane protein
LPGPDSHSLGTSYCFEAITINITGVIVVMTENETNNLVIGIITAVVMCGTILALWPK